MTALQASRRTALASAGALLAAVGAPASRYENSRIGVLAQPDAQLIRDAAEFIGIEAAIDDANWRNDEAWLASGKSATIDLPVFVGSLIDRERLLHQRLIDTPARTHAGLRAKAAALLRWDGKDGLARSLARDLVECAA